MDFLKGPAPATPPSVGFDSFYTLVVTIAVVILILVLAFLGWTMSKHKETGGLPNLQTTCPDYWKIENDVTTGKAYCLQPPDKSYINYGDDGASSKDLPKDVFKDGKFDFTNTGWSAAGGNAVCAKKKWADSHKINWDTVTNTTATC